MYFAYWKLQGRFSLLERNYYVFMIIIRDVFTNAWLAEADITKVTVALYYVLLTKVTSDQVLGTVTGIHLVEKKGEVN